MNVMCSLYAEIDQDQEYQQDIEHSLDWKKSYWSCFNHSKYWIYICNGILLPEIKILYHQKVPDAGMGI